MKLINYFRNVLKEVKNITFPTKQDVEVTSLIIIVIVLIFMFFIGSTDFVISKLIKMLLGIM